MNDKMRVVGAGAMGTGIAQTALESGLQVSLTDTNGETLKKAQEQIFMRLTRKAEKGSISEQDLAQMKENLTLAGSDAPVDCGLIVEAVYEDLAVKETVLRRLSDNCPTDAMIATNTSSISPTRLACFVAQPERFIGLHFFNPVPVMKLLEIIPGLRTSEETLGRAKELGRRLGKEVIVSRDEPAFIVNRLLDPMINEAVLLLETGVGTVEDIDNGCKYGLNHPMGPLELADMAGIDILHAVMNVMHRGLGDSKYRPSVLLQKMVDSNFLGKKTGAGFYLYDKAGAKLGVNPIFK